MRMPFVFCAWWVCLLLGACEQKGGFLYLTLTGVPDSATRLELHPNLDGRPANEQITFAVPQGETPLTLGLRLQSAYVGEMLVDIGAFDAQHCLIATGTLHSPLEGGELYQEFSVALQPSPRADSDCSAQLRYLYSVTPSSLRTTGRDPLGKPVPLHLQGWGFQAGMQVMLGDQPQPPPRIVSFQEAVIDAPQVSRQLGSPTITIEYADRERRILAGALTVTMTPIVSQRERLELPQIVYTILDHAGGDFDGDHQPDLARLGWDPGTATANIHFFGYQQPGTLYQKASVIALSSSSNWTSMQTMMSAGDLNGDGIDDLVVATPIGGAVLRSQKGMSHAVLPYSFPLTLRQIALADIDADGRLDLVLAAQGLAVHRGNGDGTFAAMPLRQFNTVADALLAIDMNGDQKTDLIALSATGEVIVYLNEGGTLNERKRYPINIGCPGYPGSLAAADLDKDGTMDIVANGAAALLLDPLAGFHIEYIAGAPACFGGLAVYASDMNGDGEIDLAWAQHTRVLLLPNQGRARFDMGMATATPIVATKRIIGTDLNLDGTTDLVWGSDVLLIQPQ